jgi:hypothetical protein
MADPDPAVLPAVEKLRQRAAELESTSTHPCWMFVRFSAEAMLQD